MVFEYVHNPVPSMDTKIGSLDVYKPACNDIGSLLNGATSAIQSSVSPTVINSRDATLGRHLARRLVQIGVINVFTIPGDFNLTLLNHLIAEPGLSNIGCCNELNARYVADSYGRSRGVDACVVTFTVGGLNVLNMVAGAYNIGFPSAAPPWIDLRNPNEGAANSPQPPVEKPTKKISLLLIY